MELSNVSTKVYKSKGHNVNVPVVFAEGHVLTANEANFANRQLASVTLNVLASALARKVETFNKDRTKQTIGEGTDAKPNPGFRDKDWTVEDLSPTDVQTIYDRIAKDYEIGVTTRGEGKSARDPVQSIAENIAWERIKARLQAKKIKVNSIKADKKAELVAQMLKVDPSILETAKAQFGADTPTDGLDDLFADLAKPDDTTANAGGQSTDSNEPGLGNPSNPVEVEGNPGHTVEGVTNEANTGDNTTGKAKGGAKNSGAGGDDAPSNDPPKQGAFA